MCQTVVPCSGGFYCLCCQIITGNNKSVIYFYPLGQCDCGTECTASCPAGTYFSTPDSACITCDQGH